MKRERWFRQDQHNVLGNFIMATPMIKVLSKINKKPIPVFFETKALSSLFNECPFIKILRKKPRYKPGWSSIPPSKKSRKKDESDTEALIRIYCRKRYNYKGLIPETYVDSCNTEILKKKKNRKYVAIFHGCLSGKKRFHKEIPLESRDYMVMQCIDRGLIPVIIGSKRDYRLYWNKNESINNGKSVLNYLMKFSLRDSVSILNQCDYFMSNDTGLYHVAGALKKRGLVLWKKTDPVKNKSFFGGIDHFIDIKGRSSAYSVAIDSFLDSLK